MEPVFQAHPIPQNVTNFEFHLVGDMTLKQFAYLAGGVGFAFLIFTTLSTVQPIIAWPIIVISSLLGVAFAFLPIQERPLDHWVGAFFKAIFQPTSLKFSSKILNTEDPLFNKRLSHYLKTYKYEEIKQHAVLGNPNLLPSALSSSLAPVAGPASKSAPPPTLGKKQNFIDKFKAGQTSFVPLSTSGPSAQAPAPRPQVQPQPAPIPTPPISPALKSPLAVPVASPAPPKPQTPLPATPPDQQKMEANIPLPDLNISRPNNPVSKPEPLLQTQPQAQTPAPAEVPEVATEQQLKKTVELAKEAQKNQEEIIKIESSLAQIKQQAAQPGVDPKSYIENFEDLLTQLQKLNQKASETAQKMAELQKEPPKPAVSVVPVTKAKSIPTLKLTTFPNVINGIVTDSLGNYLSGAIVVAHDKQGLPVRALKSNKLGQFVAATPLPNGEYSITVEKDDLLFDKVGIELTNEILPPILMAAKKLIQ